MDTYYFMKQTEILRNMMEKKPEEILKFLNVDIEDSKTAESIVREFKFNLSTIKRKYASVGATVGIKYV